MNFPNIPVPVWEQIPIVIVFSFLMAGLGWVLVRLADRSMAGVNATYTQQMRATNEQWQRYFDARIESFFLVNQQMLDRMDEVARVLTRLATAVETPAVGTVRPKRSKRVGV